MPKLRAGVKGIGESKTAAKGFAPNAALQPTGAAILVFRHAHSAQAVPAAELRRSELCCIWYYGTEGGDLADWMTSRTAQ